MADWTDGFDALIAPHDRDAFLTGVREREPVHLRHGPDFVDGLLDLDDLDEQLTGSGLRWPTFRLDVGGQPVPPDAYTHDSLPWGPGRVDRYIEYLDVLAFLRKGASLVMDDHHRAWPPLAELTREVELALGAPAAAASTLAMPRGTSAPHRYEVADSFVIQTAGRRRWRVHEPAVALPVAGHECPEGGVKPGALVLDVELVPGDVLYLPRGTVYQADAVPAPSLHCRIDAAPRTWLDVLGALVDAVRDDVRLRRSLPLDLHGPNDAGDEAQAELQQTLEDLARVADLDGLLDRLARQVATTRMPLLAGVLPDLVRAGEITLDSVLVRRDGIVWRAEAGDGGVKLSFHGRTVSMPWHAIQTARFLGESGPFEVRDLPGDLDDLERVHLCGSLVSEGFLTFAD